MSFKFPAINYLCLLASMLAIGSRDTLMDRTFMLWLGVLCCFAVWTLGELLANIGTTLEWQLAFQRLVYLGVVLGMVFWLFLAIHYAGLQRWLSPLLPARMLVVAVARFVLLHDPVPIRNVTKKLSLHARTDPLAKGANPRGQLDWAAGLKACVHVLALERLLHCLGYCMNCLFGLINNLRGWGAAEICTLTLPRASAFAAFLLENFDADMQTHEGKREGPNVVPADGSVKEGSAS